MDVTVPPSLTDEVSWWLPNLMLLQVLVSRASSMGLLVEQCIVACHQTKDAIHCLLWFHREVESPSAPVVLLIVLSSLQVDCFVQIPWVSVYCFAEYRSSKLRLESRSKVRANAVQQVFFRHHSV